MWNTFEFGEQAPIPSVCSPPPLLPREASLDIDTSSTMLWLPSDGFTDSKAPATAVARAALDAFVLPPEIANAPILDQLEARPQEPCLGRIVSNEHTTRSPLHAASKNGHTEVMRVLLAKGVAIDCVDQAGLTALHHAALCGNVEGVVLLLQYNADTSIEDHEGCTALYHAASAGYEAIVRILT
ncbi:Ankyrin repeat-containing protein 37 [Elsinoe fawcettii]|nr:Ankyrin repeat-containing protein 37 [Elsinoe fawcettii]